MENTMHLFQVRYRDSQGTLMRILNAVSRRGISMPYLQAEPSAQANTVTLMLAVNARQAGQLMRDWNAVIDVIEVLPATQTTEQPKPPQEDWSLRSQVTAMAVGQA